MTGNLLKSGLTLAAIAAICTAAVAATYQLTRDRIAANEQAFLEQSLQPALSGVEFDGGLTDSKLVLPAPHGLPGNDDAIVYRVYADGAPAAALFAVTARDGYSGPIRILVGIREDGTVTGVRILEHRETPGLGDKIEIARDDWITAFNGLSLANTATDQWAVKKDGGQFDQFTGATITPRAVVNAVHDGLLFYHAFRPEILADKAPAQEASEQ